MYLNEDIKANYLVMDKCTIHKSKLMMRKIKIRGYKLMRLPPYSPELLRHVMPHLLKFYITLPVILNDKAFNVIIKLHSKCFEVKKHISFLGQFDLTYCDIKQNIHESDKVCSSRTF